jgi:hypothetical protein
MTLVKMSLRDLSRLVVLQTQRGKSRGEVVKVLVARGWPEISAVRFVDMTLFEQGGHVARARVPEKGPQPTRRAFSAGSGSWKALFVVGIVAVVLTALLIACVLAVLAR